MCRANDIKAGNKMGAIVENSTMLGFIGGTLNPDPETVENHTRQIESLKKEIEDRDKTLSRLKQDFNDLQAQNDDLKITLESKNHEIEALKDNVDKLEAEKEILERKLQNVELEFEDLTDQNNEKKKEINDLKVSLESKDKEITAVKREVEDLRDQNNKRAKEIEDLKHRNEERNKEIKDLKISLETKGKEITVLTRKVTDLKDQNEKIKISLKAKDKQRDVLNDTIRELRNELKSFKLLSDVRQTDWQGTKKALKKSDEKYNQLELEMKKLEMKLQRMMERGKQKEEEYKRWQKEFQENMQPLQSYGRNIPSPDSLDSACILLAQMCSRVQAMMYQKVHPDGYDEDCSYKVKFIKEDIALKEGEDQHQASKRWEELKTKLGWINTKHPRTLKEIQNKRNETAHPEKLTKDKLLKSAKVMQDAKKLHGWMSFNHVHEIIRIWDLLEQME